MKTNCNHCETLLNIRPSRIKENNYCNSQCFSEFRDKREMLLCSWCDEETLKSKSDLRSSKTGNVFCNRSCANSYNNRYKVGDKNGNFVNGHSTYRSKAFKHYEAICHGSSCELIANGIEIQKGLLDVHHIDGNRKNNEIENLVILCVWCHAKITRNIKH